MAKRDAAYFYLTENGFVLNSMVGKGNEGVSRTLFSVRERESAAESSLRFL